MKNDPEINSEKLGETDPLINAEVPTYASINDLSNSEKISEPSKESANNIFGINVKKGVTFTNLFALFYIAAIMTAVSGYINAQMTFLL